MKIILKRWKSSIQSFNFHIALSDPQENDDWHGYIGVYPSGSIGKLSERE